MSAQGEMSEVRALKATRGEERKEEGGKGMELDPLGKMEKMRRRTGELEEWGT